MNMKTKTITTHALIWIAGCGILGAAFAGDGGYTMERSALRSGGQRSSGGAFELSSTIGEPLASVQFAGNYELTSGFQIAFATTDCDGSASVNLTDYIEVPSCLTGPMPGTPAGPCACHDVDGNGTVDLADFSWLQNEFTGG